MFATGVLAHSLLLPLISILVQMFVVNFWFVGSEEAAVSTPPTDRVIAVSLKTADLDLTSAYNILWNIAEIQPKNRSASNVDSKTIYFFPFDVGTIIKFYTTSHQLRAPPLF